MADGQPELKAGHPPAVKAGGMRITQHKPPKEEKPKEKPEDLEDVVSYPPKQPPLVISGAVVKGDAEFTPEAVRSFHNKPVPQIERRNSGGHKNIIHQPRK